MTRLRAALWGIAHSDPSGSRANGENATRDELDPFEQIDQLNKLTEHDERALQIANLRYALATHIPAMKRRVWISTGYGSLEFYGPQARKVTALCEDLLRRQLQRLERKGGPRR